MNTKNRTELKCRGCGCLFYSKSGHLKQRYCSKECGYKNRKVGGKKGKKYPNTERAPYRECLVCGDEFKDYENRKNKPKKYCSKKCWSKRATVFTKCGTCRVEIKTTKSQSHKFCSNECRNKDYEARTGENAQAWLGGKTSEQDLVRASLAYRRWRDAVYRSNNFKCAITRAKGYLNAHHIENFSSNKDKRIDISNGVPLIKEIHEDFHRIYGKRNNSAKQLFEYAKEFHSIDTIKINGKDVSWAEYRDANKTA